VSVLGNSEAEDLLDDLMAAMNKLASAGYPVTAVNGRLECRAGMVVPSTGGRWASRPLVPSFPSAPFPLGEWTDKDGW
jgi:hypothetical protein